MMKVSAEWLVERPQLHICDTVCPVDVELCFEQTLSGTTVTCTLASYKKISITKFKLNLSSYSYFFIATL